jgi:restriction system protein
MYSESPGATQAKHASCYSCDRFLIARRRNDESLVELFYGIFMRIPPWTCIPIAVVAYGIVSAVIIAFSEGNKLTAGLAGIAPLAGGGVAALILLAGFKAFVERMAREKILAKQTGIESIRSLSWSQFELLVGQIYRQQGYEVVETGGGGPDGGIDLKLRRDGLTIVVQCKQWKSWKVGVGPLREIYGVMIASGADRAIFVTSGVFTKEALAFAADKPIGMVDGTELLRLLAEVQGSEPETSATTLLAQTESSPGPVCPRCRGSMILRTARRGANAGSQFWGCSGYPKCTGTRRAGGSR